MVRKIGDDGSLLIGPKKTVASKIGIGENVVLSSSAVIGATKLHTGMPVKVHDQKGNPLFKGKIALLLKSGGIIVMPKNAKGKPKLTDLFKLAVTK